MKFLSFVKQHSTECICFTLFIVLALIGFAYHEPMYDEAEAWQIARTASYHDILFFLPHYEGHPPLWHLLLSLPAKAGISWQLAIPVIGFLFMLVNGALLFFKAPFPKWVRCLLPFSFFLFFQYGIVVRPYSLMTTIMLLLAMYFAQKDKRPSLYVGLLALLCATHLFGIAIAGGITMAWLWEIKNKRPWKEYLPSLRKDPRFHRMIVLLLWAILLVIMIYPTNEWSNPIFFTASIPRHIIYILFAMPAEAVLTNITDAIHIMQEILPWGTLLSTSLVGILLWITTIVVLPRKHLLFLLLPYLCWSLTLLCYASCHHIGIALLLFIYYFWINLAEAPFQSPFPSSINRLLKALLVTCLLVPIGWNMYVLYLDTQLVLYPGKEMVAFLNKYKLTDENIFANWGMNKKGSWTWDDPEGTNHPFEANVNSQPEAVILNMYLPHNIFANFHDAGDTAYVYNITPNEAQTLQILQRWRDKGLPTVLINPAPIALLYNNEEFVYAYHPAYITQSYRPWKFNRPQQGVEIIYLHDVLWEKLKDRLLADYPNLAQVQTKKKQSSKEKTPAQGASK